MPKATPELRQANAAKRAIATVVQMNTPTTDVEDEDTDLPPTAVDESPTPVVDERPEKPKSNGRSKAVVAAPTEPDLSKKRQPSEDFFDYLARITPEEWSNSQTSGLYIYKKSPKGNVRITDEPVHGPISLGEFREQFYPSHGDGNYRLQFTTSLKHLSSCGENVTFDSNGAALGSGPMGSLGSSSVAPGAAGFSDAIKATSEMLKDGAKAAVEVSRAHQMDQVKGLDVAALLTGLAGFMPKQDNTMVQFLIADAQKRAEAAEKQAIDQRRLDKEETDRREKAAKDDRRDELDRREREYKDRQDRDNKFWELMLKEKEKKSDEFGITEMLKGIVVPLMKERMEGGGAPEGWAGVAANFADRIPDVVAGVSALMAARNGATPQQVQQIQASAQGNPQLQPPQQAQGPQVDFAELMKRIARYLSRDSALWNTDDGREYILGMLEEEYPSIRQDLFINQPREIIYQAIQADPYGANIMAHEIAKSFVESLVDAIKVEETGADPEPELEVLEKPNGKHRKTAVVS